MDMLKDILSAFWPVLVIIVSSILRAYAGGESGEMRDSPTEPETGYRKLKESEYSDSHRNKHSDNRV